jgi:DNA-binding NtrC family response regulator
MWHPSSAPAVILIVDGNVDCARVLERHFDRRGIVASVATRGAAALAFAHAGAFAVAIVDLELPDMRGDELLRILHAIDPGLPLVATMADPGPPDETRARACGIAHWAPKPFDFPKLDEVVARAVWRRQLLETRPPVRARAVHP